MFTLKKVIIFVCTFVVFCNSAFVDNLPKCDIDDGKCLKETIKSVLQDIAKTGVSELGIPPIDPIVLKDLSLPILGLVNLTVVEGTVKGIKDCIVHKFEADVEAERAFIELTCDATFKGHYKVYSNSPLIKTFLGGETIHGDGNAKVKIEKMHLRIDYFFYIQKRADDIYIKCKRDKTTYTYDIRGKMTVFADNLYLGKQESSQMLTKMMNENWRYLMTSFGKPFMDKAMEYAYDFTHKFFDTVPVKYYIANDLTKYARE